MGSDNEAWTVRVVSWCDFDQDGDVDQEDFGRLQNCLDQDGTLTHVGCEAQDLDGSGDVDISDFYVFQACQNGAGRTPACPQ